MAVSHQQRKGKNGSGIFVFIQVHLVICSTSRVPVMSGILLKICSNPPVVAGSPTKNGQGCIREGSGVGFRDPRLSRASPGVGHASSYLYRGRGSDRVRIVIVSNIDLNIPIPCICDYADLSPLQ